MARRGFTLVEIVAALGAATVLAALAWPGFHAQLWRAGRAEAIDALTRLQVAQEKHREMFGRYAADLRTIGITASSASGRYEIVLALDGAESYSATARVREGSRQSGDRDCPALTLTVAQGFASSGPDGRCWNR
jgi:type IV pilus assembly protein PilE